MACTTTTPGSDRLSQPPSPTPAAEVLVTGRGSIDDTPGIDQLTLHADGTLVAGTLRGRVTLEHRPSDYWLGQQASLSVVMLDASTPAVLVALPTKDNEDPPNIYELFIERDGALVSVFQRVIGVYGVVPPQFPGDGTLVVADDAYEACSRVHKDNESPERAMQQRHSYRLDGVKMALVSRVDTGVVADCTVLPACPFVYVVEPGGERTFVGEILRWVRGASAATTQGLRLGEGDAGRVTLHVSEEKPETTYLDHIELQVDGVAYPPTACVDAADARRRPAFCDADNAPHILREGRQIELTFDVPAGRRELVATGYYVPTRPDAAGSDLRP